MTSLNRHSRLRSGACCRPRRGSGPRCRSSGCDRVEIDHPNQVVGGAAELGPELVASHAEVAQLRSDSFVAELHPRLLTGLDRALAAGADGAARCTLISTDDFCAV